MQNQNVTPPAGTARIRSFLLSGRTLAATAALTAIYAVAAVEATKLSSITLEVDVAVARGGTMEIYLDDLSRPPLRASIRPGERHTYRFANVSVSRFIRIDPTDTPDSQIDVFGVALKRGSHPIAHYGPEDLRGWSITGLQHAPTTPNGAFALTSINNDPVLSNTIVLPPDESGSFMSWVAGLINQPQPVPRFLVVCGALFLLAGCTARSGRIDALIAFVVLSLAAPVARIVINGDGSLQSVRDAVGHTAYTGYTKSEDFMAVIAAVLIAIITGLVGSLFRDPDAPRSEPESQPGGRSRVVAHLGVVLFLAALLQPNIQTFVELYSDGAVKSVLQWDDANNTVWAYLMAKGFVPYRDFWYTYAGFFTHYLPLPYGPISAAMHSIVVLWFLYLGLYVASGRRLARTLLAFAAVVVAIQSNAFPLWSRYLLSVDLVLFYVAVAQATAFSLRLHVPFAVLSAWVLFFEPVQFGYAAVAIAVHMLLTSRVWTERPKTFANLRSMVASESKERARYVAGPMAVGLLAWIVVMAASGMLGGIIAFHSTMSAMSAYAAAPVNPLEWLKVAFDPKAQFLVLFVVAGISTSYLVRRASRSRNADSAAFLVALAGLVVFQKLVMRPFGVDEQLQVIPFVAAVVYVFTVWHRRTVGQVLVVGMLFGLLLGSAVYENTLVEMHRILTSSPEVALQNYKVVTDGSCSVLEANRRRFHPSTFSGFTEQVQIADVLRNELRMSQEDRVFVLSDVPVLYIVLGQPAPYLTNQYNASPLAEQIRQIRWLEQIKPRFTVWDASDVAFDGVPHTVRVPLIYRYIIQHYQPLRTVGKHAILERRDGPVDLSFWRERLGARIDLGHIVESSRGFPKCDDSDCHSVLMMDYNGRIVYPRTTSIRVSVGGQPFWILFHVSPERQRYSIPVERLWFWQNSAEVRAEDGVSHTLTTHGGKSEVLY